MQVVHAGPHDRYVLYAVLHHPGLGTPSLSNSSAASETSSASDGAMADGAMDGTATCSGVADEAGTRADAAAAPAGPAGMDDLD